MVAFYAGRYGHSSPEAWERRLAAGELSRNGLLLRADAVLAGGDRLVWRRPPWPEPAVPAAWGVIHDDGDLLVIDKPSGLPVLPVAEVEGDPLDALRSMRPRGCACAAGTLRAARSIRRTWHACGSGRRACAGCCGPAHLTAAAHAACSALNVGWLHAV